MKALEFVILFVATFVRLWVRWLPVLLMLLLLLMLAPVAFAAGPLQQAAPPVPDVVKVGIGVVILFLVVNGLKDLSNLIGQDLSGWGTVIAGAITAIVIFALEQILEVAVTINPGLVPWINAVFQVLVMLLGAMGVARWKRGGRLVK